MINVRALKALRDKRLWSQEELATACGVSLRTIQRVEGEGQASAETVKALAAVFEVEHNYFYFEGAQSSEYVNIQLGFGLIVIFIGIASFFVWGLANAGLSGPVFLVGLLIFSLICGVFSTLTTRVTNDKVEWHFTLGFLRKAVALNQIKSAKIVRNKWWWGLGIRFTPNGWLYCVSGLDAIMLRLENGHKISIGTDELDEFMGAIDRAINGYQYRN